MYRLVRKFKQKMLWFLACVCALAGAAWYISESKSGYFVALPISYESDCPSIHANIDGKVFSLQLQVGARFPLFLKREVLESVEKKECGTVCTYDTIAGSSEVPVYRIAKMQIGDLTLSDVQAVLASDSGGNTIGQYLGGQFNLFLDILHSRVIVCDSFAKLKKKGIAQGEWTQVPFRTTTTGATIRVETDLGPRDLSLNWLFPQNLLKSSKESSDEAVVFSDFQVGTKDFGKMSFVSIPLSDAFSGVDGFIGREFLKDHAVYLDYANQVAYIEIASSYFERFAVRKSDSDLPVIDIRIGETEYPVEVDLGMKVPFAFNREILQGAGEISDSIVEWRDFKWNSYESPLHVIPEVILGALRLHEVYAAEVREAFHKNTATYERIPPIGVMGAPVLEKYNAFLDFPRGQMAFASDLGLLQRKGLMSQELLVIPFIDHNHGMMLAVETDSGILHLILDTGATCVSVRAPYSMASSKFCLGGHDFGEQSIMPIELTPEMECDGFLGMDFLNKHALFIDYASSMIYLDLKSKKN